MATTLSTAAIERLADQLIAARAPGAPGVITPAEIPVTDADAYAVQTAMMRRLARLVRAWKVGAANPTAVPNGAPIFDVHPATAAVPATRPTTGVELEIAFTLGRDFPAASTPPSRADVESAIASANIVLETCASRLADGMEAPAALRLADFGTNLGLVMGPAIADWRSIDLSGLNARVAAGDSVIADMRAAHTAPDLIGLTTWLIGHVVTTRGGMLAGTIVTTGSWSGIRWVTPPAKINGTFNGVGSITVDLA